MLKILSRITQPTSGKIEIKVIPEARILVTREDGSYFEESNLLFGRLFNYIKGHNIPMTAPVEGSLDEDAKMIFYVGPQVSDEGLDDEGDVRVIRLPERNFSSGKISGLREWSTTRTVLLSG